MEDWGFWIRISVGVVVVMVGCGGCPGETSEVAFSGSEVLHCLSTLVAGS